MTDDLDPAGARALRRGLRRLGLLCVAAAAGAGWLSATGSDAFQPYFGPVPPLGGTLLVALVALLALGYLDSRGWFAIHRVHEGSAGVALAVSLGALLPVPVILVDLLGGFPRGINVPVPEALLFYPTIALVAETVFHAAPLALLLALLPRLLAGVPRGRIRAVAIVVAACLEPVFQVLAGRGESPTWAVAYVGAHLLAFNLVGLYVFTRYGFLATYLLRLSYYLLWHIVWGVARLSLLF